MTDAEVIVLQKRLKAIGLYNGSIDGDFGPATLAACLEGLKDHKVIEETQDYRKQSLDYSIIREKFGSLNQSQVDGFETILKKWELTTLTDLRWLAYMFATTWHETAKTMQPITEYGSQKYLRSKKYWPYIGRGYVQLTWKINYERYDIADEPERALEPNMAAHIMIDGMTKGIFTGKKLSDYFNSRIDNPVEARRIINGKDKAELIASYHQVFLKALKA